MIGNKNLREINVNISKCKALFWFACIVVMPGRQLSKSKPSASAFEGARAHSPMVQSGRSDALCLLGLLLRSPFAFVAAAAKASTSIATEKRPLQSAKAGLFKAKLKMIRTKSDKVCHFLVDDDAIMDVFRIFQK